MPAKIKILICVLILFCHPVQAKTLTYAVYAGGFKVVNITGVITDNPKSYHMNMDIKLSNWLYSLAAWQGSFVTDGQSKTQKPVKHIAANRWHEELESKTLNFNQNGFMTGTYTKADKTQEKIVADKAMASQAVDVLTPLWVVMQQVSKTQTCQKNVKVFDGRRSFLMMFQDIGEKVFSKSRYNMYTGPALGCTVEIKPLQGKWHEKPRGWLSVQEQSKLRGEMPTLYFAKVPGLAWPVVVRAVIKTRYGTAVLHLTNVTD